MFKCDFSANPEPLHLINDSIIITIIVSGAISTDAVGTSHGKKRLNAIHGTAEPPGAVEERSVRRRESPAAVEGVNGEHGEEGEE